MGQGSPGCSQAPPLAPAPPSVSGDGYDATSPPGSWPWSPVQDPQGPLQGAGAPKIWGSATSSPSCSPPQAGMGLSHQVASPSLATTLQSACWSPANRKVFLIGMLGVCLRMWSL